MRSPPGSVVGLCSASASIFAVGMAFLGYWGFLEPAPWRTLDLLVVVTALIGFAALALVPWIATTPVVAEEDEKTARARRAFAVGVIAIWLAVVFSLFGSHGK